MRRVWAPFVSSFPEREIVYEYWMKLYEYFARYIFSLKPRSDTCMRFSHRRGDDESVRRE